VVTIAGYDILRDEGIAYVERMQSEGVEVEHKIFKGFPHCPYGMVDHPEIIDYYNQIVSFVEKISG
jgi:acetyl esterase/lipase